MVNLLRRALAGFVLVGREHLPAPAVPYLPESVVVRACGLRGYSNKDKTGRLLFLTGHGESELLRQLRGVVVEGDKPPAAGTYAGGLNLVVFRGVFGSGGYSVDVRAVTLSGHTLTIECDYENPGEGIRTTAGFTQPTAIIPLVRLPEGRYEAQLVVRQLCRSAQGVREVEPARQVASAKFSVMG